MSPVSPDEESSDAIRVGRLGIAFLVHKSARALGVAFDDELKPYGLDHARLVVLRNVLRQAESHPTGVSAAELAKDLIIPLDVFLERCALLERDHWLVVHGSGAKTRVLPTPKASATLPVLIDATRWTMESALNGFDAAEIETLTALLRRLLVNLDRTADFQG